MVSLRPKKIDFEEMWGQLQPSVEAVIACREVSQVRGMELVEDVFKICTSKQNLSERLYRTLAAYMEEHVDSLRVEVLEQQCDLLETYLKHWEVYAVGANVLDTVVFRYLNSSYVRKNSNKFTLRDVNSYSNKAPVEFVRLAMHIWRERLLMTCHERIRHVLLREICRDRDGEDVRSTIIRGVVASFVRLNEHEKVASHLLMIYHDEFEKPFLAETAEYYDRESRAFLDSHDCSSYIRFARNRLEEEEARNVRLLDPSSLGKARNVCLNSLVTAHVSLLQVECGEMIESERINDLSGAYQLLRRIPGGTDAICEVLQRHVTDVGMAELRQLGKNARDPHSYAETMLGVHRRFSSLVVRAFENDAALVAALDKGCRSVINAPSASWANAEDGGGSNDGTISGNTKAPELLARYCDLLLRKGSHSCIESELEEKLAAVITIFSYVDDKDIFQKFYSKHLAKRLIYGGSVSDEAEEGMIGRLKQACGYEYTSKLQRMFTDVSVSNDMNVRFVDYVGQRALSLGSIEFKILVLQAGAWPLGQTATAEFNVPIELEKCVLHFETFYNCQYNGRKLSWLHHLCKGELRLGYLKRRYDITVSSHQMAILLLFNKNDSLSVADISEQTRLKGSECSRALGSLVDARLLKSQCDDGVTGEHVVYSLNFGFSSKRTKIKISVGNREADIEKEASVTHMAVDDDRKVFVQAAIVRVMKARKQLAHMHLMREVITLCQARFQPSIPSIKKNIEALIDKSYLERTEDRDTYRYLA